MAVCVLAPAQAAAMYPRQRRLPPLAPLLLAVLPNSVGRHRAPIAAPLAAPWRATGRAAVMATRVLRPWRLLQAQPVRPPQLAPAAKEGGCLAPSLLPRPRPAPAGAEATIP